MTLRKPLFTVLTLLLAIALPVGATERAATPSALIIPAASTVQGVAGTGTAVTYTISGTLVQGTVETYAVLAQGQLPTSTGVLYTVPAGAQALVSSIALVNATGSAVSGVKLFVGGSAAANQVLNGLTIPVNGSAIYNGGAWTILDANGALQTATSTTGITSLVGGTGINISGGNTINLTTDTTNASNISSGTLSTARLPAIVAVPSFNITGAASKASIGATGAGLYSTAATYTDTASSGTVSIGAAHALATPTLAASSATTFTDAATLYIASAPTAGTGVTITNGRALYIASGSLRALGGAVVDGAAISLNASSNFATSIGTGTTTQAVSIGGASNAVNLSASGGTMGFFGATPAVQTTGSTDVLAGLVTLGLRAASSNPPLNLGSGAITAGAISSTALTTTNSTNGAANNFVINTNGGTATLARSLASNDNSTGFMTTTAYGTAFTTAGGYVQDSGVLESGAGMSGGMSIISNVAPIRLYSGGSATGNLVSTFSATQLTLADPYDLVLGTTTGTKIGTATTQKLSVYGVTPVVQRAGAAQAAVATTAATNIGPYGYTQAQADAIIALLNEIRASLVAFGIIKGAP